MIVFVEGRNDMKEKRKELRYKIMTILYQIELYKINNIDYNKEEIIREHIDEDSKFVREIVDGVTDNVQYLDRICNGYLEGWTMDRLGFTDRAILRMGVYELLNMDTPDLVAIDGAIELAKKYSDERVVSMINGVLDKVYHNKENM